MFHRLIAYSFLVILSSSAAYGAEADRVLFGSIPNQAGSFDDIKTGSISPTSFSGYVETDGSMGKYESSDVNTKNWAMRGAINVNVAQGYNLQVDGSYHRSSTDDSDSNGFDVTGHGYYRPGDGFALGGFVGYAKTTTSDDISEVKGGIEAAWLGEYGSFYGRVGYGQMDIVGFDFDHVFGGIGTHFYINDNLRWDLDGQFNRVTASDITIDIGTFKTALNYRMDNLPITVYGGYRFDDTKETVFGVGLPDDKEHTIFAGVRYSFGSTSLKDEEMNAVLWQ